MRVRMRRNRSYWLRSPLTHEWYPLSALSHFVRPGDTVWDVGANVGLYSLILTRIFKARRVVAFEPMAQNRPLLSHNITVGGVADKVHIVPCALGNVDEETDFQTDDIQSASGTLNVVTGGQACVAREKIGLPPITERVQCRSVDSLVAADELPKPNVMKIDVEGAERILLDGASEFLRLHDARLVIETHGAEVSRACLEFLFDHGFFVAACVPENVDRRRHKRLDRAAIRTISGQYDAHFIVASKIDSDLDFPIEHDASKLLAESKNAR